MSDGEEPQSPVEAAGEVEVSADTSAGKGQSVLEALKGVLKLALIHDGLARGLREASARKVVNCSCVVVRDWGEESQERTILLNYFQTEN